MVGSLWTGISGLATHQAALDNESHNIANVNTIGYKSSRISFADQMYQDSIGKGSKVINAEKVYSQGGIKTTGVAYDIALKGSGFLAVKDPNATGSSEEFYTRAGNLRMGESGNLQDATQFDVLGWGISPISVTDDITTTNSNIVNFTNDYTRLAANQIIKHDGLIQTITGKFTDYISTAQNDQKSVMSGLGYKSSSSKISDLETLITEYQNTLKSYANDPSANSSPSISQLSAVSLPALGTSRMSTGSDQIYLYVDGKKYTQSYIETVATTDLTDGAYDSSLAASAGVLDNHDNILASRIATYKALADQISAETGLKAYIGDPSTINMSSTATIATSTFNQIEGSETTFSGLVGAEPILVIESLIPGKEVIIGDTAEYIATDASLVPGSSSMVTTSVKGTGYGAVESAKQALLTAGAGLQRDVWSSSELPTLDDTDDTLVFSISNPADVTAPFTFTLDCSVPDVTNATKIDDIVAAINSNVDMAKVVKAHNYNGNLVVETISSNPGGTFAATMSWNDGTTSASLNKSSSLSINSGTDSEFIEIINNLDQNASRDSLQLRLDSLGISDSAFGDFSVDSSGVIMMTQDGATYAIGQVSIAMFNNERGLTPEGNNKYSKSTDSGLPIFTVNNDKTATIESKTLELSTADLSESLVNLMVYQRAFEANSKSITTSDQLLTTLIQLKK